MAHDTRVGRSSGADEPDAPDPASGARVDTSARTGTDSRAETSTRTGVDSPDGAAAAPRRVRWRGVRRAGRVRPLVAVAAGLLLWTAFPPLDLIVLAPAGVAALTLALRGMPARAGAWLGFLAGAAFFLPVLTGIVKIGPDAWVLLSLVQALYFVPMAAAMAAVSRLRGWPVWIAALWVAQELARGSVPFGGFPWARLAFSQTATLLTPYAALGGAPLVTFVTALTGTLLAAAAVCAVRARREGTRRRGVTGAAAALGVIAVLGAGAQLVPTPTAGRAVTVAVVQGNVPRLGLDFLGQRKAVLDNHVRQTHALAAQVRAGRVARPELVVWPENASDLDPYAEPDAYTAIDAAVKDVGVPVLVGALVDSADGTQVENRGIVWDPVTGPGDYYVKRHPVPFGEYLPFRPLLTELITRFERIPRDFARGTRSGVMRLGPVTIGDVICFEVAYDREVRDVAGGELLVVQTNNATYGRTSLPPQQIAMSRLRAVEHGRTILVAATSGISAVVAPDGRVLSRSAEFTPDLQVAAVPARTDRTVAGRVGAAPEWALTLLGVGAVVGAAGLRRRRVHTMGNEGNGH
ncbi:apolipoprotein N-acyltransferase [Actinomadura flavalba]|uniref:apolipoprotein N-acyltransferase n=1 Tax=Actinomadura flavalba TaxID=1120938 RepID=UPI00039F8E99|nr:apolipoprotein N-acyltransferase [Actinomadura flavalba]